MNTPKQSIGKIAESKLVQDIGTIKEVDVLGRDPDGNVTAISPSVIVQLHTTGGLARAEMPRGWDLTTIAIGDDVVVISDLYGRWLITQVYASSNRTQAGSGSHGFGRGLSHLGRPKNLVAKITGSQLELSWTPVKNAILYQIWQSITGSALTNDENPANNAATIIGQTATSSWVSKDRGSYFDDGYYYAVTAMDNKGRQSSLSSWVQPTFVGSPTYGLVSKNQSTVIPGSLVVCKSGSITRADFTSVDSPTTFTIDVCDPLGTHPAAAPFANGDILRFVDVSGNVLWVTISSSSNQTTFWRYTVTKSSPAAGTNRTIKSGSAVENWGQLGQGIFLLSADGTFGAGTLWAIVTHAGAPWTTTTTQVSADSTGKITFAAGAGIQDASGIRILLGTSFSTVKSIRMRDAADTVDVHTLKGYYDASVGVNITDRADGISTKPIVHSLEAYVPVGAGGSAQVYVAADYGAGTKFAYIAPNADASVEQLLARGDVLLIVDNTYDIGASGANRPRDLFLGRNSDVAGVYKVDGVQVVSNQRTGWTDQTAAASRADLGATPTVGALASFCRALYDDLKAHGLIST